MKKKFVLHPFLFAAYPILFLVAHNVGQLFSIEDALVPMVVMIGLVVVFFYLLSFICSNKKKAGLLISLFLVLFLSYGHFYAVVESYLNNDLLCSSFVIGGIEFGPNKILYPVWGFLFVLGVYLIKKTRRDLTNFTNFLNFIAFGLILVSIINIVPKIFQKSDTLKYDPGINNEQINQSGAIALPPENWSSIKVSILI